MSITRKARINRIGGAEERRKLRTRLEVEVPALERALAGSELGESVFVDLVLPVRSGGCHLVGAQRGAKGWFVFSAGDDGEQVGLLHSNGTIEDIDKAFTTLVAEIEVRLGLRAEQSA